MAGAWQGGLQLSNSQAGSDTTASSGINISGSGSAYTKGPWTQVIAAMTGDSAWMMVTLDATGSAGASFCADIGVGPAGSEFALVQNLECAQYASFACTYLFPLAIPAGTRVSARMSSDTGGDHILVAATLFGDTAASAGSGSAIDTYGFSPSTNLGTAIDPGTTANTKGGFTQIAAALTADISGFFMFFDTQADGGGSTAAADWLLDVAVGPGGSERVLLPNFAITAGEPGGFSSQYDTPTAFIPLPIPAGTRVSIRAQCSTAVSPDRIFGVSFYGVRA